jgi:hypothetical protein
MAELGILERIYEPIAKSHELGAIRREQWTITKLCRGLTRDGALCALKEFKPREGWAVRLGAEPKLVMINPVASWCPPDGAWITAAEAVSSDGTRSLAIQPGQAGLDLVEISVAKAGEKAGRDVLVVGTGFAAAPAPWGGAVQYAVAWAEGFTDYGAGHLVPVATRFLGFRR